MTYHVIDIPYHRHHRSPHTSYCWARASTMGGLLTRLVRRIDIGFCFEFAFSCIDINHIIPMHNISLPFTTPTGKWGW